MHKVTNFIRKAHAHKVKSTYKISTHPKQLISSLKDIKKRTLPQYTNTMAPPALIIPYCETPVGLQSVYCHPNDTSRHGHEIFLPEYQDQLFGTNLKNDTPHAAALLDPKTHIGGEASSNVAVDISDHSVVGMEFDFEQSLATIAIVLAILGILYLIRSGSQRMCHSAKTHFGAEAKYNVRTAQWRPSAPDIPPRNNRMYQDYQYPNVSRPPPPPPATDGRTSSSRGSQ